MPSIAWRTLFFMWLLFSVGSAFFSDSLLAIPSYNPTHPFSAASTSIINPLPCCIHVVFVFYHSEKLISIWPSHTDYHTCSSAWASSKRYFQCPKKKKNTSHARLLSLFFLSLWIHCFITNTKFIFLNLSLLLSYLCYTQDFFFHPE